MTAKISGLTPLCESFIKRQGELSLIVSFRSWMHLYFSPFKSGRIVLLKPLFTVAVDGRESHSPLYDKISNKSSDGTFINILTLVHNSRPTLKLPKKFFGININLLDFKIMRFKKCNTLINFPELIVHIG